MPDSPPLTPPQQNESHESDTQQNPNPPVSDAEDPFQKCQLSTSDTQNPPSENPIDGHIPTTEQPEFVFDEYDDDDDDDQEQNDEPEPEPELELENAESEGMNVPQSPISQSTTVSETYNLSLGMKGFNNKQAASLRRTTKRKKSVKNHAVTERKAKTFLQFFNPIHFAPGKTLDFSRYEDFLKKLGLWDFAHIEFDKNLRADLIAQLIVSYTQKKVRGSYVIGSKLGVSRADLARALKLPLPNKLDCCGDVVFPQDFLSFLEEFVSNWMLLHEDLWCTPDEIVASLKNIKDGSPNKVDWAGLIWYMVEKELVQRHNLKDCYYASHLQLLIKFQKQELLGSPFVGVANSKAVMEGSKETVMVDDDEDGNDMKMMEVQDSGGGGEKLEEQNVELRLGQDCVTEGKMAAADNKVVKDSDDTDEYCEDEMEKVEGVIKQKEEDESGNSESVDEDNKLEYLQTSKPVDDVVNAEILKSVDKDVEMVDFGGDYKEEEQGQEQWLLDGKLAGQPFLQRCSVAEMKAAEDRGLEGVGEDEDVEEDGDRAVEGFKIMTKSQLDGMNSANLMQAFETGHPAYPSTELGGHCSLDLMSSRADDNIMLGGPSMFNHAGKRAIDHGYDMAQHGLNDMHKRMRVDNGSWEDKTPDFAFCMDQMQSWAEKAKMRQMSELDEAYHQANIAQNIYSQQLTQKESEIVQLRYKLDEVERSKNVELDCLNREIYLLSGVIDGYRRALKHTQNTFSEYRKRCKAPDEPVYKDAGLRGVVKSVTELERDRLKQEEENKLMRKFIEETFTENLNELDVKWESEVLEKVESHHSRLMDAVKELELLKVQNVKRKSSAEFQDEAQDPSE